MPAKTKKELILQPVEYSPEWENTESNLRFLSHTLKESRGADIIILPEMFNTGFSMNPSKISEKMEGNTVNWMKSISIQNHTAVCGSLAIEEEGLYYNRFIFVAEGEIIATYDKHHLFSYGGESGVYTSGNQKITFNYLGWKICPMICFDLRFPVWNRNSENYDLMINVANWPDSRIEVWDTLLKARSMENVSYVCGVNRTGTDGMNLHYTGHSVIFSPIGKELNPEKINEHLFRQVISLDEVQKWRNKYRFLDERDHFTLL
ncbi:MAG: nitrilase family protein [Flavobacteriaceae bacterium]|jgi:predicted amidohydrolase|nr:nitrilase family protein [Flavobacteriaceae bacterium]